MGRLFRLSSITGQSAAHDGSRICAISGHLASGPVAGVERWAPDMLSF